jgi:acetyl-CoA carboxylase biotin carboxyl carrier protein
MNDDQITGAASTLDDLCRRAAELIRATAGPLKSVRVQAGDMSIEVEWPDTAVGTRNGSPNAGANGLANGVQEFGTVAMAAGPAPSAPAQDDGSFELTAPLVGTFYRGPSPGSRPFVEVGDEVEQGQQVAIVEAMKLMNAVTAEQRGRVVKVLADDAIPVEYGQPLFLLARTDNA